MKKLKFLALGAIVAGALISCQKEEIAASEESTLEVGVNAEFSSEYLAKLAAIGINTDFVKRGQMQLPDGSIVSGIYTDTDVFNTEEELDVILDFYAQQEQVVNDLGSKHYRTNNLVSSGNISIIGFTGSGGFALTSGQQTALQWAVNNYNRLNLNIRFTLTYGEDYESKDMVVYRQPNNSGAGGSAGFPSGGDPFKFVQIFSGMDRYDNNTIEHVMTHEIGHAVGFRHTDWFSRQSCGSNQNEGDGGVGAIYIPGTPEGFDSNSIMLSCFGGSEDGEFGQNDITALNFLY